MEFESLNIENIIYGALGSALFALIVFIIPKVLGFIARVLSKYSQGIKSRRLKTLWLKYTGVEHFNKNEDLQGHACQTGLIYSSLRELIKGLIWISLGLLFQSVYSMLGIIGFIGGIYYLFLALGQVQKIEIPKNPAEAIQSIEAQLDEMELNKSSKKDAQTARASS
ncbi:hypothetical protein H5201_15140 [Pseudoalteromonas sp. SG43-6]|uniref:hypothetical protein n=1 Tax=Pseudoalteromonas sp. SG43-6 TaxID=2760967 RepID=UPI0015FFD3DF|nr:hypothetical protein [Pseudoalteromonas sp. SG43-6]MBB1435605.1 hypothetical protein [Pseudoalteromonas sp. SG43-6]